MPITTHTHTHLLSTLCRRPSPCPLVADAAARTGTVPQGEEFVLVNPTIVKVSSATDVMSEVCPQALPNPSNSTLAVSVCRSSRLSNDGMMMARADFVLTTTPQPRLSSVACTHRRCRRRLSTAFVYLGRRASEVR